MKKKIIISSAIFLSVIIVAIIIFFIYISQVRYGNNSSFIDASNLDNIPYEDEKTITIKDREANKEFTLTYYNVYKNEDNEFILKDNTSYLIFENLGVYIIYYNYDLVDENYNDKSYEIVKGISSEEDNLYYAYVNFEKSILSLKDNEIMKDVNIGILITGF